MSKTSPKKRKTVFVGMSGGVDSSVAAALLKERGFDVTGVYMKCYNLDGCSETDAEDARRVAEQLHVPFYVFDFEQEYKDRVVQYMIDGYRNGITPNPDVMCNKEIKFGLFFKKARELGADYVATGHYVKLVVSRNKGEKKLQTTNYKLQTARDSNKDQSYFLWTLTQEQLRHCLFPVGDIEKPEVRKLAKKFGLITSEKKDSQGICFLGKISISDFLKQYIPEKKGKIVTTSGKVIGEHRGAYFYTIGQRHGMGIGGKTPYYVVSKDVKTNTITVAEGDEAPELFVKEIELANVNIISPDYLLPPTPHTLHPIPRELPVLARVRYRQPLFPATLTYADFTQTNAQKEILAKKALFSNSRELENNIKQKVSSVNGIESYSAKSALSPRSSATWRLTFRERQKFVAIGQSAVFYAEDGEMLGGGVIVDAK